MSTVIVLGPTGGIASAAATYASELGAHVVLAMRDPTKTIPGLDAEREKNGKFERVKADLTDAGSVLAAVKSTGAKRAFLYLAHGTPDHMKSTLEALKTGGIEFVVFLSSYTIKAGPRDVPPSEIIPFIHAKVEVNLDEVFGVANYAAVRPGGLASNFTRYAAGIKAGEVKIFAPGFQMDAVAPSDVGRVSGSILVNGLKNDKHRVFLYGPKLIPQGEGIKRIGELVGSPVKLIEMNEAEAEESYLKAGIPKPVAAYIVRKSGATVDGEEEHPGYEEAVANVELYTGSVATTFEEWVEANKGIFTA